MEEIMEKKRKRTAAPQKIVSTLCLVPEEVHTKMKVYRLKISASYERKFNMKQAYTEALTEFVKTI
jgi:hypothetical protein